MNLPAADAHVLLPDGRRLAYDDRGDSDGEALLFLHGTPDTRLARHPDDSLAGAAGFRLLAADRPGLGDSDPDPGATPRSVAADHLALLDHLGVERTHLVAWSAGALFAVALAGAMPERVGSLTLVAPLIPADAYGDAALVAGANDGRRMFADVVGDMTPDEIGRELAPWLVPPVIDDDLAREVLADTLAAVADLDGADAALIAALRGSVACGPVGLEREIAAQAIPMDGPLGLIRGAVPVTVHVGENDDVCPPAMGRWYVDRLDGELVTHAAGHAVGITAWGEVLEALPRSGGA